VAVDCHTPCSEVTDIDIKIVWAEVNHKAVWRGLERTTQRVDIGHGALNNGGLVSKAGGNCVITSGKKVLFGLAVGLIVEDGLICLAFGQVVGLDNVDQLGFELNDVVPEFIAQSVSEGRFAGRCFAADVERGGLVVRNFSIQLVDSHGLSISINCRRRSYGIDLCSLCFCGLGSSGTDNVEVKQCKSNHMKKNFHASSIRQRVWTSCLLCPNSKLKTPHFTGVMLKIISWLGIVNLFQTLVDLESVSDKQADIQAVRLFLDENAASE